MTGYIIRRVLLIVPTAFLVVTLAFFAMHIVPGDAVLASIEEGTSLRPEQIAQMRESLGIDKPLLVQYGNWLRSALQGDFGKSLATGRPVTKQLFKAIPVSLELALLSQVIALAVAIPIGVISALRQDTFWDYVLRVFSIGMLAAPNFWLATLAIVLGAYWFFWAPPFGYVPIWQDPVVNMKQFLLPAAIMGLHGSATAMRMTRSAVLEVLRQDYIRTAHAKGLSPRRILMVHVLKNALIPVVTIWGVSIAYLLGGAIIIESIFALPGVGLSMLDAINSHDLTQLQANILFFGAAVVLVNLIVDLSYSLLDPRVRYN
ncbi:MAG: ABC transporter permease [Chloroflexi bacterium]|nr:ABC transporter permease [Chloroflexota bacterium]